MKVKLFDLSRILEGGSTLPDNRSVPLLNSDGERQSQFETGCGGYAEITSGQEVLWLPESTRDKQLFVSRDSVTEPRKE